MLKLPTKTFNLGYVKLGAQNNSTALKPKIIER